MEKMGKYAKTGFKRKGAEEPTRKQCPFYGFSQFKY